MCHGFRFRRPRAVTADKVLSFDPAAQFLDQPGRDVSNLTEVLRQHLAPGPRQSFGKCAIVGSGGSLRGSKSGEEIDKHDLVIRMNHHTPKGYEEDVGSRTDLHLFYPESYPEDLDCDVAYHAFIPYKRDDWYWLGCAVEGHDACTSECGSGGMWKTPTCSPSFRGKVAAFSNAAFRNQAQHESRAGLAKRPSMGFTAVTAALMMCEHVTLFGTGVSYEGDHVYCNYDSEPQASCVYENPDIVSAHDFEGEHEYYEKLDMDAAQGFHIQHEMPEDMLVMGSVRRGTEWEWAPFGA